MRISLCMIIKNEVKYIKQCLESAIALVDEIIIVDTGSSDNTLQIIENEFPESVTLIHYKWNNNFSDARNKSLEYATGDWILVLDADEKIIFQSDCVRTILEEAHADAYNIPMYNLLSSGNTEYSACMPRLFKRIGFTYTGAIHEQLTSVSGLPIIKTLEEDVCKIIHYGYLKSCMEEKNKIKRNIGIIKEEIRRKPQNPFNWYNLGVMNMIDEKYDKALENFIKAHRLCKGTRYTWHSGLILRMTQCLYMQRRYKECISFVNDVTRDLELRNIPDLYYFSGLSSKEMELYGKATGAFAKCIEIGELNRGISLRGIGSYMPLLEWARTLVLEGKINDAIMKFMEAIFNKYNYTKEGVDETFALLKKHDMTEVILELEKLSGIKCSA